MQAGQRALDDWQRAVVIRAGRSGELRAGAAGPSPRIREICRADGAEQGLGHSLVSPEEP